MTSERLQEGTVAMQSTSLDDARAALKRSDQVQPSLAVEVRELRAAMRALIQHVEGQQETINSLLRKSYEVDPLRPLG